MWARIWPGVRVFSDARKSVKWAGAPRMAFATAVSEGREGVAEQLQGVGIGHRPNLANRQ